MDKLRLYLEVLVEVPADKRAVLTDIILEHVAQLVKDAGVETAMSKFKREHTRGRMLELHNIMPLAWEAKLDGEPVAQVRKSGKHYLIYDVRPEPIQVGLFADVLAAISAQLSRNEGHHESKLGGKGHQGSSLGVA